MMGGGKSGGLFKGTQGAGKSENGNKKLIPA